jgi:hypothetical protein
MTIIFGCKTGQFSFTSHLPLYNNNNNVTLRTNTYRQSRLLFMIPSTSALHLPVKIKNKEEGR